MSRVVATIIATVVAVAAFASFGGIGLAHGVINLAQYQYGKKITICHKQKRTITVSINAWPAHQRHGDTVGTCQVAASSAKKGSQQSGTQGSKGKGEGKGKSGQGSSGSSGSSSQSTGGTNGNGNGNGNENGKGKGKSK